MNNTVEKAATCLAIVEKKPQKPGGCVGIFFQLFDWNRRFAKKKLFSKKLPPPVRFKQASKKFGGDEKQPKLRLIADENNGGFPGAKKSNGASNVDNEQKNEMRVPSLVARLMGLDSMPALHRDKSRKASVSGIVSQKSENLVDKRVELNVERGGNKQEVRPQKFQKTSICESQPISRFGAEKLPFKNVLSKSKKHHPKLPSPVKSPKNVSRRRPSKLIGAATRILEPGLQTSRSKCALIYSNASQHSPQDTDVECRGYSLSCHVEDSYGLGSVAAVREPSCNNCGYFVDNSPPLVFASPSLNNVRTCCQVSGQRKPANATFYHHLEEELRDGYSLVAGPVIGSVQSPDKLASYRSSFCAGHIQQHLAGQQCKVQSSAPLPITTNQKQYSRNQMSSEVIPPRPNMYTVTNSKVSKTVINARSRAPSRIENGRFELEKRVPSSMNDFVPTGRKRRPNSITRQGENSGCSSYTLNRQIIGSPHRLPGMRLDHNPNLGDHDRGKVGLLHRHDRTFDHGIRNSNAASFTFNSSLKQKFGNCEVSESLGKSDSYCDDGEEQALGEFGRKKKFEKPPSISGDALGALLEQKLKELNCQGEDTGSAPKKTTATILQELITALTSEAPFQQEKMPAISYRRNVWNNESQLPNSRSSTNSQGKAIGVNPSFDQLHDSEHLSPGSVLETCFSAESFPSSSADDGLGYKTVHESLECSYCEPESLIPDMLDSAASLITVGNTKEMTVDILNNVSEILCCSGLAFVLKGNEVDRVKDVLLNAELAFHSALLSGSAVGKGSPIKHLLLDELDMLASVLWINFGSSLGVEDGMEVNQLKIFVLDSIIEYLGVRFQKFSESRSKVSRRLPIRMNNSTLILEIVEVVRRWEELSRLGADELIEREMSHSLEDWTQCESESVETGIEISIHMLQILMDEIVLDLCKW